MSQDTTAAAMRRAYRAYRDRQRGYGWRPTPFRFWVGHFFRARGREEWEQYWEKHVKGRSVTTGRRCL